MEKEEERKVCDHTSSYVTPEKAFKHLQKEAVSLERGEGTIMTAGLSNVYGACVQYNLCYCLDCHRHFTIEGEKIHG